jgi:uncharacterized protein YndB with AHSA1/START domain
MGVDVTAETLIRAAPNRVAAYAADPGNAPEWYVNIKGVEWKTNPPLRVGSRMAFVAEFLGRRLAYTYEVVELVPGRRLVMHTAEGPFPMTTTYEWEATPEGFTRMKLRNQGEATGFSRVFSPFLQWSMGRAMRKDLALVKKILEPRPS